MRQLDNNLPNHQPFSKFSHLYQYLLQNTNSLFLEKKLNRQVCVEAHAQGLHAYIRLTLAIHQIKYRKKAKFILRNSLCSSDLATHSYPRIPCSRMLKSLLLSHTPRDLHFLSHIITQPLLLPYYRPPHSFPRLSPRSLGPYLPPVTWAAKSAGKAPAGCFGIISIDPCQLSLTIGMRPSTL